MFGVYASVLQPGVVSVGDEARLVDEPLEHREVIVTGSRPGRERLGDE